MPDSALPNLPAAPLQVGARSPFGPLLVWLLLQMTALGISAWRVPFYAPDHFPRQAESIAIEVMLAVQIGSAALLFPYLLRDARAAGFVVVAAWPFTLFAQHLSGPPMLHSALVVTPLVSSWIIGLSLWRAALRGPRGTATAVAVSTLLAFLGPLDLYLRSEYGDPAAPTHTETWGPILAAHAVAERGTLARYALGLFATHSCIAAIAWAVSRRKPQTSIPGRERL